MNDQLLETAALKQQWLTPGPLRGQGAQERGPTAERPFPAPAGNTRSVLNYGPFPTAMARAKARDCGHRRQRLPRLLRRIHSRLFGHSDRTILQALRRALDNGLSFAAVARRKPSSRRFFATAFRHSISAVHQQRHRGEPDGDHRAAPSRVATS